MGNTRDRGRRRNEERPQPGRPSRLKAFSLAVCLGSALCAWGPGDGHAATEPAPAPEKAREEIEGTRVVEVDRNATDEVAWIRIWVLSDTPPGVTWDVIQNVQQWDRFMDLYSQVSLITTDGTMDVYELNVSPPWPISDAKTVVRVLKQPAERTLSYWVELGFMKGTHGKISVEEAAGGSRILFENLGAPTQRFPDWMVKIGVYLVMPSVLEDLRGQILRQMEEADEGPRVPAPSP